MITGFYTILGHFLVGLTDSLDFKCIINLLFYTNPRTGRILHQSVELQKTLGRSLLQAGVITTFLPLIIKYMGFEILYWILMGLSLIFTYGYLTFYNMDVTDQTMNIMKWRYQNDRQGMIELDVI